MSLRSIYDAVNNRFYMNDLDAGQIEIKESAIGGGGIAGCVAFIGASQSLPNGSNVNLKLGSADSANSFGSTNLVSVLDGSSNVIGLKNNGSGAICVMITGFVSFSGTPSTEYSLWVARNGDDTDRYGLVESLGDNDYLVLNFSCSLQLASNDIVNLRCWVNGSSESAGVHDFPPMRFLCTQMNASSGSGETPSLSAVCAVGADAGGASITNVSSLTCTNLNVTTVNGSSYPPSGGGGSGGSVGSLSQVLAVGSSAGGANISNVGNLTAGSVILGGMPYTSALIPSASTKGIMTLSNPITATAGNVFDDVFNPPNYFSTTSYVTSSAVAITASTGAIPKSLSFGSVDLTQSFGTSPLTASTISVVLNGTTYHYYCYKNASPNTVSCNVSCFGCWDNCSEGYRGLYASYIPASMVTGMAANGSYSIYTNPLGAVWEYFVDNYPVSHLQFNVVLQHGDSFQLWALSNQNCNFAFQTPTGQMFGASPNLLSQNARMTVTSNYRMVHGAYSIDSS